MSNKISVDFEVWTNKKNQHKYLVLQKGIKNATNAQDWQDMYLYVRLDAVNDPEAQVYVREESEFLTKFENMEILALEPRITESKGGSIVC